MPLSLLFYDFVYAIVKHEFDEKRTKIDII